MGKPDPSTHPNWDPVLTLAEAAQYAGVHVETLRKAVRLKELAVIRRGRNERGHIKIRMSSVNRWIKRDEIPASKLAG